VTQRFEHSQALVDWLRSRVGGELRCDSRRVQAHDGFVAWPGGVHDARRFVTAALDDGASAAVVEAQGLEAWEAWDDRVASLPELKAHAGGVAAAFYDQPMRELSAVAITGTNGKTSTAWWLAQLLCRLEQPCAIVGTLGLGTPTSIAGDWTWQPTGLTTPDPVSLHGQSRRWVDAGVRACAIEASSIGLAEGRLNGAHLRVAVFTNFTQDHLDFHGDMASYWLAKSSLFDWPTLQAVVIHVDDPKGSLLKAAWSHRPQDMWTVSADEQRTDAARLQVRALNAHAAGQRFDLIEHDAHGAEVGRWRVDCPLLGDYNRVNLLCVLASVRALGVDMERAVAMCPSLTAVPGRLQPVSSGQGAEPLALVDYAHTPDAVEQVLRVAREVADRRGGLVWAVLGCGGDRDASKRPLMAAAAERGADRVVLTSDNPRSESPASILDDMAAGLVSKSQAVLEIDRTQAIYLALHNASANDVVVIAGKGHEDYQEVAGVRHPFSDARVALAALQQRAQQGARA
jgi:UDP-N-acetylmuramoyl-L-alanyl-D-glutamate--2,6-diaminopimelate ligase